MHSETADEKSLIAALRNGSKDAFIALYDLYGTRLFGYCQKYMSCTEDAEDVVQDIFMNLWKSRSEIRDVDTLGPFLYASAHNRIINLWKERTNSMIYADYVSIMQERSASSGMESMEYQEFKRRVLTEIAKLKKTQRTVVMLSRFENLDVHEIATRLGLSVQTVKNALSTGLRALRDALMLLIFYFYFMS